MQKFKRLILLLVVIAALAASSLALAQSSPGIDLGCWGMLAGGGGVRQSATAKIYDSFGVMAVGKTTSVSASVIAGPIQNWPSRTAPTPAPTPVAGEAMTYLPVVTKFFRTVRVCR